MGLETLTPLPRSLVIRDHVIDVYPIAIGKVAKFAAHVGPVLELIMTGRMTEAVFYGNEHMVDAVALATDLDRGLVAKLNGEEFMELAEVVVEVNQDFFFRKFLPVMLRTIAGVKEILGQTPLPDSSSADTASPTSLATP